MADYPKMIYKPNERRGIRVNSAEEEAAVLGGALSYTEPVPAAVVTSPVKEKIYREGEQKVAKKAAKK